MSIFYNLFKQNDEMRIGETATFSEISYMPILKDQGNYLVGVKRFKLPSQGIDYFRIYPNRYFLGNSSPDSSIDYQINESCHITDIFFSKGDNYQGYDYDAEQQEYYIEINSDQAFASVLNRTIAQSFQSRYSSSQTTHSKVFNSPLNFASQTAGYPFVLTDGSGYDFPLTAVSDGQTFLGFECHLREINSITTLLPADRTMGDIVIDAEYISVDSSGKNVITYIPLLSGFAQDVKISEFNTKFPGGVVISSYAKQPSSKYQFVGMYNYTGALYMYPEGNEDLDNAVGFMMAEAAAGGGAVAPTMNFRIRMLNGDGTDTPQVAFTPRVDLRVFTGDSEAFGRFGTTNNYATDTASLHAIANGVPHFNMDNTSQRMSLSFPSWLIAGKHGGVYCSNGLLELMNFGSSKVNQLYQANNTNALAMVDDNVASNKAVLSSKSQLGGFLDAIDVNKNLSNESAVELVENHPSQYKRSFLWGIQIRSNNLSNDGEFVNAGRVSQKILTDFIIDPSSNSVRDYLIFEPQMERFYPLNASGDLRQLDVSVFYVDMNNNTHLLPLPPNTSASIKIEFRPQNMVYNYVDSKTM